MNFRITPGCLWLPVVLCSCPMVKLHFCNLFFLCWHNLEKFYCLFIMPCVFLACCIVDPIYGFVSQWYWMPAKGQLTSALILDWFLTRFHWLCNNQDDNLVQQYISGQLRLTIIQCRCICTSTCTVSPDLSNFIGNLGIRNLFKGG